MFVVYCTTTTPGGSDCNIPRQAVVKEVSVFKESDHFRGLVVSLRDALSEKMNPPEFEVLFTPTPHFKKFSFDNQVGKRIWMLEVMISIHS